MSELTRQEIFSQASKKLRQDFDALSSVPHNALRGQEAEKLIRSFLNNHLPKRFSAGAGFIIDRRNKVSKQTDVIIYDAFNCPIYRVSEDASIFPSDNVAAVVEVKSCLDKDRLHESFENIQAVKSLAKTKPPELPFLIQTQTLGCLFAFDSSITLDKISQHYYDLLRGHSLGHHIDLIVVLDKGIIILVAKVRNMDGWAPIIFEGAGGPAAEGSHLAIGVHELGSDSLDAFLRLLLAHLTFFRGIVDHPGFDWQSGPTHGQAKLTYLTSITLEKDPKLREQKLRQYADEVKEEFSKKPASEL